MRTCFFLPCSQRHAAQESVGHWWSGWRNPAELLGFSEFGSKCDRQTAAQGCFMSGLDISW
jgi:hypothetical protein